MDGSKPANGEPSTSTLLRSLVREQGPRVGAHTVHDACRSPCSGVRQFPAGRARLSSSRPHHRHESLSRCHDPPPGSRNCSLHREEGERQHRDRPMTRAIPRRHGLAVKKTRAEDAGGGVWRRGRGGRRRGAGAASRDGSWEMIADGSARRVRPQTERLRERFPRWDLHAPLGETWSAPRGCHGL